MAEKVEVLPLIPPPFLNCLMGSFTLTCKIVELGIDLSGDEELMRIWYPHSQTLPFVAPLAICIASLAVPLWFVVIFFKVPEAARGKTSYVSCFPVVGIPLMAYCTIRTFVIIGPTRFPSLEVRDELVQARAILLLVASALLLVPSLEFKASVWGISKGLRSAASAEKQEAASLKGIPAGAEVVPLMAPPLFELCCLTVLWTLCLADFGVVHTGDPALTAAWASASSGGKMPTVSLALGLIAVAAACKVVRALRFRLPAALRKESGSLAGSSPIVLAPLLAVVWHSSELSKSAAVLKGGIVFAAMCCTMVELGTAMKGITHLVKPAVGSAGSKGGEKVE